MAVTVTMERTVVVSVAPDNEESRRWGVCALPPDVAAAGRPLSNSGER